MAVANAPTQTPETGPIILTLTERVTEDTLGVLARNNPEYRFETTSDGKLVVSLVTATFASAGEAQLVRQLGKWPGFQLDPRASLRLASNPLRSESNSC